MIAVIDRQEMELVGANQTLFSFFDKKDLSDFKHTYACICESFESTEKADYLTDKDLGSAWILELLDKSKINKAIIRGRIFKVLGHTIDERYIVATFTDITEMVQQDKELEQLRTQQMKEYVNKASFLHEIELVSSIALPALIVNGNDRLTAYNNAFVSLFDMYEDTESIEDIKTKQLNVGETFLFESESICKSAFIDWKEDRLNIESDEADVIEIPISSQRQAFHIYISKVENQDDRFLLILHRV